MVSCWCWSWINFISLWINFVWFTCLDSSGGSRGWNYSFYFLSMLVRKKETRGSGDSNGIFVLVCFGACGSSEVFCLVYLLVSLTGIWDNGGFLFVRMLCNGWSWTALSSIPDVILAIYVLLVVNIETGNVINNWRQCLFYISQLHSNSFWVVLFFTNDYESLLILVMDGYY